MVGSLSGIILYSHMSSHHIIRDEQEPALILADLDTFPFDLLGQLLEWAPYTVCGDSALDQALDYGINLDVVISSRPNLKELLGHFPTINSHKRSTDWLSQAIDMLVERNHQAVNIVTSDPFNEFDWMNEMSKKLLVDVITPSRKYIRIESTISKWLPSDSILELHGESIFINGIEVSESFTTKKEGTITVSSDHAPFIIGLSL